MTDAISRDQTDPYWTDPEEEKTAHRRSQSLREAQEAYWEAKYDYEREKALWEKE